MSIYRTVWFQPSLPALFPSRNPKYKGLIMTNFIPKTLWEMTDGGAKV